MAIKVAFIILCVAAVSFFLRVLAALVQESICSRTSFVYPRLTKVHPTVRRGELIVMHSNALNGKVATKSGVRIALVVLVCATLRLPLHSQQIFNSAPTESASQAPSTKQQIPQEVVQQLEAQLKQVKKFSPFNFISGDE